MGKRRLGRGLNSLIGSQADDHAADDAPVPQIVAAEFMQIDVASIERNPYQPRQVFDQPALDELKESIIQHGILQPLLVRKVETGFQLVAGERRLIAAKNAGLRTVPCKVAELDDRAVCEVAIMENLQREDLSELEKGEAFHAYLERFICTIEDLAKKVGKDRSTISNALRLLELPDFVKQALRTGKITAGHARSLLQLEEESDQIAMCQRVQSESLSVRQTEEQVRLKTQENVIPFENAGQKPADEAKQNSHVTNHVASLQQQLRDLVGLKVEIRMKGKNAGKLIIHFNSNDEFERAVGQLRRAS